MIIANLNKRYSKFGNTLVLKLVGKEFNRVTVLRKNAIGLLTTFSEGSNGEKVMRIKKDFKRLNPTDLNLLEGTQLYMDDTLYTYYKGLWNECKRPWNGPFTVNGTVRIKSHQDGPCNSQGYCKSVRTAV